MEERWKHKITSKCVIKEKIEKLGEKSLHDLPRRNRFTKE